MPTFEELYRGTLNNQPSYDGFMYPEDRFVSEQVQQERDAKARQIRQMEGDDDIGVRDITSLGEGNRGAYSQKENHKEVDYSRLDMDVLNEVIAELEGKKPKKEPGAIGQIVDSVKSGLKQAAAGTKVLWNTFGEDDVDDIAAGLNSYKAAIQEQVVTEKDKQFRASMQANSAQVNDAQGILPTLAELSDYARIVASNKLPAFKMGAQAMTQSIPGIAGGLLARAPGAAAGAMVGGPVGAIVGGTATGIAGGTASNYSIEAAPNVFESLVDKYGDQVWGWGDKEIAAALRESPDVIDSGLSTALKRSAAISAVQVPMLKLAGKVATIPTSTIKGLVAKGATAGVLPGVGEAGGELAAQVAAGQPIDTAEAVYELTGGVAAAPVTVTMAAREFAKNARDIRQQQNPVIPATPVIPANPAAPESQEVAAQQVADDQLLQQLNKQYQAEAQQQQADIALQSISSAQNADEAIGLFTQATNIPITINAGPAFNAQSMGLLGLGNQYANTNGQDVAAELAGNSGIAQPDNAVGSVADIPVQPDAGSNRGRTDNAPQAFAQSGGNGLLMGNGANWRGAVSAEQRNVINADAGIGFNAENTLKGEANGRQVQGQETAQEVKTFANATEGDIVESGGAKFRKVGNGFERVNETLSPESLVSTEQSKVSTPELSSSADGIVKKATPANASIQSAPAGGTYSGVTADWQGNAWDGKPTIGEGEKVDNAVRPGDIGTGKANAPFQGRGAAISKMMRDNLIDTHEIVHVGKNAVVLRPIKQAQSSDLNATTTPQAAQNKASEPVGSVQSDGESRNEAIRPIVEAIAKRRAVAEGQLGKAKAYGRVLEAGKRLLNGESVNVGDLKIAANELKADKELHAQAMKLVEIASQSAKQARKEAKGAVKSYRERIAKAKSSEELRAIANEVRHDTVLSDAQAQQLDGEALKAEDALDSRVDTAVSEQSYVDENASRPLAYQVGQYADEAERLGLSKALNNAKAALQKRAMGEKFTASKFKKLAEGLKRIKPVADILNDVAADIDAESRAKRSEQATARAKSAKVVDPANDDIFVAMAKLGGLNADDAEAEFGFDPADMKKYGFLLYRSFTNGKNAKSPDGMREALAQYGYKVGATVADFGNALDSAMRGIEQERSQEDVVADRIAKYDAQQEEYNDDYDALRDSDQNTVDQIIDEAISKIGEERVSAILAEISAEYPDESPRTLLFKAQLKERVDEAIAIKRSREKAVADAEGKAGASAENSGGETGAENNGARGTAQEEVNLLSTYTNQEVLDREQQTAARESAANEAERKAEDARREAQVDKERQSRAGIAADAFTLTPTASTAADTKKADEKTANDQFAGQGSMFGNETDFVTKTGGAETITTESAPQQSEQVKAANQSDPEKKKQPSTRQDVSTLQGMRKALNSLGYPNADLSRTERRVTINSKAVLSQDQFTVDIEFKNGKWKVFEIGVPELNTEEKRDAMQKFRADLAELNGGKETEQVKAEPAEAKDRFASNGDALNDAEKELRNLSHENEADGDVLLGNGRFVSFDDAVRVAREAIASGVRPFPAQLNFKLDLAMRDIDRVLAEAKEAEGSGQQGSGNTFITDEKYEEAKAKLAENLAPHKLNSNPFLDPENARLVAIIGAYHIEHGARTLAKFTKAMKQEAWANWELLKERIESIFAQSMRDWELSHAKLEPRVQSTKSITHSKEFLESRLNDWLDLDGEIDGRKVDFWKDIAPLIAEAAEEIGINKVYIDAANQRIVVQMPQWLLDRNLNDPAQVLWNTPGGFEQRIYGKLEGKKWVRESWSRDPLEAGHYERDSRLPMIEWNGYPPEFHSNNTVNLQQGVKPWWSVYDIKGKIVNPAESVPIKPATYITGGYAFTAQSRGKKARLFVLRNMELGDLNALKSGVMNNPSIALTDKPITGFGEITFVGDRGIVQPKEKGHYLFSGDAWTVMSRANAADIIQPEPQNIGNQGEVLNLLDSVREDGQDLIKNTDNLGKYWFRTQPHYFGSTAISSYLTKEQNEAAESYNNELSRGDDADKSELKKLKKAANDIGVNVDNLESRMLEHKIIGDVSINDFPYALVPKQIATHAERMLRDAGYAGSVVSYDAAKDNRLDILQELDATGRINGAGATDSENKKAKVAEIKAELDRLSSKKMTAAERNRYYDLLDENARLQKGTAQFSRSYAGEDDIDDSDTRIVSRNMSEKSAAITRAAHKVASQKNPADKARVRGYYDRMLGLPSRESEYSKISIISYQQGVKRADNQRALLKGKTWFESDIEKDGSKWKWAVYAEGMYVASGTAASETKAYDATIDARVNYAALYSRSVGVHGNGIAMRDAEAVIDRLSRGYNNLPPILLFAKPSQLKGTHDELLADINKARATADVEAAFHEGKIYVFIDNLSSTDRLEHVLFNHEVGHYGLRGVFGQDLDPMLDYVLKHSIKLQLETTRKQRTLGIKSRIEALEEVIVDMKPEELVKLKGWNKVAMFIRNWLESHGFTNLANRVNDYLTSKVGEDQAIDMMVADMITKARNWAKNGKRSGSTDIYLGVTRLSDVRESWYYSQLEKGIEGAKQESMPAAQWKLWLASNAGKMGIKQDEIQWTGINEYLDLQGKGKVSKADILNYLAQNGVQVQETMLGNIDESDVELWWNDEGGANEETPYSELSDAERNDAIQRYREEVAQYADGATKYATYKVPGGENYRELLLTLPVPSDYMTVDDQKKRLMEEYGTDNWFDLTDEQKESLRLKDEKRQRAPVYKSNHFDQPNILAHVRFDERTDADGKRVLFLHEIQSDFAQTKRQGEHEIAAPFIDDTKAWVSLALKRMIAYAASNGFDKVAIISGQQAADLYDLSKQINMASAIANADGTYSLIVEDKGGNEIAPYSRGGKKVTPAEMEDVVGKELSKKLIDGADKVKGKPWPKNAKVNPAFFTVSGIDLKIGGEGMRAFYDQIVPQVANDVLKKVGGGKVESIVMEKGGMRPHPDGMDVEVAAEIQTGFTITPAMREKVASGLPLFSKKDGKFNDAFWKWFGDSKVVDDNGMPLVVYHGTKGNFDTFDAAKQGASDFGASGRGFYFSEDAGTAGAYAALAPSDGAPNVMPVYLAISNPLELGALLPQNEEQSRLLTDLAKSAGHDGIVVRGADGVIDEVIAFNPEQIKSAIGNKGQWDANNPDIRYSRKPSENDSVVPAETKAQAAQRVVQDQFNRFKVLNEWLNKQGFDFSDSEDVYLNETQYHGRVAARKEDFRETVMKPLIEKTQKAGFTIEQVADFLMAQHAPEANKRQRDIHQDDEATAYGITDDEARQAMDEFKKLDNFAELKAIASEWRGITEQTKKILLDSGLRSKEEVAAWEAAYDFYIPVKGDEQKTGTGKGLHVNAKHYRRLGHEKRDEAVIENILSDHERAIALDEKNRVGKALIRWAVKINNPDIITVGKPEKRQVLRNGESRYVVQYKGKDVVVAETEAEARYYITAETAAGKTRSDFVIEKTTDPARVILQASPMLADNEVTVYVGGNAVRVQINDEIAARAYKRLGVEHLNSLLGAGRIVNNWLSKVYTGYSPDFIFTNMLRDATQGLMTLTGEYGITTAAKVFANYRFAVNELIRHFRHHGSSDLVADYRAHGGAVGAAYLSDLERIGNDVMSAYDEYAGVMNTYKRVYDGEIESGSSAARAQTKAMLKSGLAGAKRIPAVGHLLRFIERINAMTENALRVATYKTLVDSGVSKNRAAAQAKNLMNFNRKGEISNQAGALYLFFNPGVQGSQVMYRALFDSKHKKQVQSLVGMMVLNAIAISMLNASGDDDDKKRWDETKDSVKDGNLVFTIGGTNVTITLPYGYRLFHMLGNVIYDYMDGKNPDKLGIRLANGVFENLSPLGNPMNGGVFQMFPTAAKMAAGPGVNQDSRGNKIGPKRWNDYIQDSQLMNRSTRGSFYDSAADFLNDASGGNDYQKGYVDVSPETLKFWVRSLTGGAGQAAFDAVGFAKNLYDGVDTKTKNMPIIRRFVADDPMDGKRDAFYEAMNDVKQSAAEFNAAKKAHDTVAMREMLAEDGPLIRLSHLANNMKKMADAKRDAIVDVKSNDKLTPSEKMLKIEQYEKSEAKAYDVFLNEFERASKRAANQ